MNGGWFMTLLYQHDSGFRWFQNSVDRHHPPPAQHFARQLEQGRNAGAMPRPAKHFTARTGWWEIFPSWPLNWMNQWRTGDWNSLRIWCSTLLYIVMLLLPVKNKSPLKKLVNIQKQQWSMCQQSVQISLTPLPHADALDQCGQLGLLHYLRMVEVFRAHLFCWSFWGGGRCASSIIQLSNSKTSPACVGSAQTPAFP